MSRIWLATAIVISSAALIGGSLYYWPKTAQTSPLAPSSVATATPIAISRLSTPVRVKGIYMTGYTFSQAIRRDRLFDLIRATELNSVVIDFKDPGGRLMLKPESPDLALWPQSPVALDREEYKAILDGLGKDGIYAIARITTFQDPAAAAAFPKLALRNSSGSVWQDYRGVTWLDMTKPAVWDLVVAQIKEAEAIGFDEVQLDYIRFPSDGNIKSIAYADLGGRTRAETLNDFYAHVKKSLSDSSLPLSIDLFGLTYQRHPENPNYDMGIGQRLSDASRYFDYISPMVYPSHYQSPYAGCDVPANCPFAVINKAMKEGAAIMASTTGAIASTRPWLQDFDLGADYDAAKIREEIRAADENGASGWLLWNASNNYTAAALNPN